MTPATLPAQYADAHAELDRDEDYDFDDMDCEPREDCDRCGGDGHIELAEAPELWGEDCMSEKNRLVTCPNCNGTGLLA